jgi:hypothetical protein
MVDTPITGATPTTYATDIVIPVAIAGNTQALNISVAALQAGILAALTPAMVAALFASANLSTLSSSDPGDGKPWLNSSVPGKGVMQVGS